MVKLIDILKELNIQPKTSIGQGLTQTTYASSIKPEFVIKKLTGEHEFFTKEDWKKVIETFQKNPDVFAIIDRVNFDKGYIVQEKLDEKSLSKELVELHKYLKDNNILYRNPGDKWTWAGWDILTILYANPSRLSMLDNTPYEETLKPKLEDFFKRLDKAGHGIRGNFLGDLRITKVGYDNTGKIKVLDFSFDDL